MTGRAEMRMFAVICGTGPLLIVRDGGRNELFERGPGEGGLQRDADIEHYVRKDVLGAREGLA